MRTGKYVIMLLATIAATSIALHAGDARRRRRSEARTAAAEARAKGTAPSVSFLGDGADTLRLGNADRDVWVILHVTATGCRPCDRLVARLVTSIPSARTRAVEFWVVGPLSVHGSDALAEVGLRVRTVHPLDPASFRDQFGLGRIPYLALVDPAGVVRAVQVGYWDGVHLDRFDPKRLSGLSSP